MNVIKANGMDDGGFKDMPAPKDTSVRSSDTAGGAMYNATMAYKAGGPGMTNMQAGVASLALSFIQPSSMATRATVIPWMPAEKEIPDPRTRIISLLKDAGTASLTSKGFKIDESRTRIYESDTVIGQAKNGSIVFYSEAGQSGCSMSAPCDLYFGVIQEPDIVDAPMGIEGVSGKVYEWKRRATPFFGIGAKDKHIDEIGLLKDLSSRLPGWVYLYIPPNKFSLKDGTKIGIPMMLNKGNEQYFVK